MIFYALFSLYQLKQAAPPWCSFKASKESAGNSTRIVPSQLSTQCVTQYGGKIYVLVNVVFHISEEEEKMSSSTFLSTGWREFWMRVTDVVGHVSCNTYITCNTCIMEMSFLAAICRRFFSTSRPFSTVTSLCCLITSTTNAHSSERESGGGEIWIMEE